MRKRLSKISALLMALVMVLSMCVNAFAASAGTDVTVGTTDDTGTITVSGIEDTSTTITVTAYPIILAYYNESGNFSDYVSLYPDYIKFDSTTDSDGNVNGFDVVEEDLDSIRNDLYNATNDDYTNVQAFVTDANNNVTWTYTVYDEAGDEVSSETYTVGDAVAASYTLTYDGTSAYTANVPIGSYLIIVSGAEAVDYNEAVVSTYYESDGTIAEGSVNMISDGNTWVKAATPTVSKNIVDSNGNTSDHNSANIGDDIPFQIVVDPIPNYGGSNPVFNLTDVLSRGLTIDENSLEVYVIDSETKTKTEIVNTDTYRYYRYTLNTDSTTGVTTLYITFVLDTAKTDENPGGYTLNAFEGDTLYVEYTATLNENAVLNENANTNEVTLEYSVDSRKKEDTGKNDDETYTYTFDIDGGVSGYLTYGVITKYGEEVVNGEEQPLAGATFTLYTDSSCKSDYIYTNDVFNGTVTSDEDGQLTIKGLEAGTYYLKETKAPTGYTLNDTVYEIQIRATYNEDGTLKSWVIVISDSSNPSGTTSSFSVTYNGNGGTTTDSSVNPTGIANTKTTGLPSTGGYGTMIFTLIGCAVMIISAAAYIKCRDKKAVR